VTMTIRERSFVLINKNVLGEDFRFFCFAGSGRVLCDTFTFSRSLRFLLLLLLLLLLRLLIIIIFLLLMLVRTLLGDWFLIPWMGRGR